MKEPNVVQEDQHDNTGRTLEENEREFFDPDRLGEEPPPDPPPDLPPDPTPSEPDA